MWPWVKVKVNIINMWCIPVTEAVTVSNLIAIASLVFEIWVAMERQTHSDTVSVIFLKIYKCLIDCWKRCACSFKMSGRELLTTVTLEVYYKYCKIYKFTLLSFDITTATMQKKPNEEISWNEGKNITYTEKQIKRSSKKSYRKSWREQTSQENVLSPWPSNLHSIVLRCLTSFSSDCNNQTTPSQVNPRLKIAHIIYLFSLPGVKTVTSMHFTDRRINVQWRGWD